MRAIDTNAREILVGRSALQLVLGNFVAPDKLDRKLAQDAAEMQKSGADEPGGRPDTLLSPAPHPAGARGSFGNRAQDGAWTVDGDRVRYLVFGGALGAALLLGLVLGLLIG